MDEQGNVVGGPRDGSAKPGKGCGLLRACSEQPGVLMHKELNDDSPA